MTDRPPPASPRDAVLAMAAALQYAVLSGRKPGIADLVSMGQRTGFTAAAARDPLAMDAAVQDILADPAEREAFPWLDMLGFRRRGAKMPDAEHAALFLAGIVQQRLAGRTWTTAEALEMMHEAGVMEAIQAEPEGFAGKLLQAILDRTGPP